MRVLHGEQRRVDRCSSKSCWHSRPRELHWQPRDNSKSVEPGLAIAMRSVLPYVLMVCCWTHPLLAETGPAPIDISDGWKFSPGDDAQWSDAALDDSQWKSISVGSPWEQQGHDGYDGFGWYRLHVHIPTEFRDHPGLKRFGFLRLVLGRIDDVDQTWWNGQLIGETGKMPDDYSTEWSTGRTYRIPARLIQWDVDNVIAIRVFDGENTGGMYEGPYGLRVASWQDFVTIRLSMGRGDGIFFNSRGLPIRSLIRNESSQQIPGEVQWTVETDQGKQLATESSKVVLPAGSEQSVECGISPTAPGFYRVKCTFHGQKSSSSVTETMVLGYRPEEVETVLTRGPDFDQFWKQTLEELHAVEPQIELTHKPEKTTATHDVYEVAMRSLGGVRVRGWYERPKAQRPHPALLRVPGYSQDMQPTGTADALAVLSFNIRGHGNSQQDVSGTPTDYWLRGLDDKQGYFYQGAYADCVRAVDFLVSRKEIDSKRIAVTGDSQGGGLSLVTAGLDMRISLCAPNIPFLCNWNRYFKTSSWPEMDAWIKVQPYRSWDETLRTMSYFDALNFADKIHCPIYLGLGLQDGVCPPVTIFAVYNKLLVPKEYLMYPEAEHWVGPSHQDKCRQWIQRHFAEK